VPAVFSRESDAAGELIDSRLKRRVLSAKRAELLEKKQPVDGLDFAPYSVPTVKTICASSPPCIARSAVPVRSCRSPSHPPPGTATVPDTLEAKLARLEQAVREAIEVTDDDLYALARARAEAVQARLLGETGIDPGRVFLSSPTEGKVENGAVIMALALR
jgi:hypothetical protein